MSSLGVEWGTKYTLTGPDGTVVTFNDSTDPNFVGFLNPESSGLETADVREDGQDSTEEDGGVNGQFFFGRRPVILQGTVIANSKTQRNERVGKIKRASNALREDAILKWKPEGAPAEVELRLRRQQRIAITKGFVKDFMLPFVCADAFIKTVSEKTLTLLRAQSKVAASVEEKEAGANIWSNLTNALGSDNLYATTSAEGSGKTPYIRVGNYAFALTAGVKIMGVEAFIEKKGTSMKDLSVMLSTSTGAAVGTDKSVGAALPGADTVAVFGGPNDLWGLSGTLTKAVIESVQFAINYRAQATVAGEGTGTVSVDQIKAIVYYADETKPKNEGDTGAFPIVTVEGPISTLTLKNKTTGKELILAGLGLLAGETLTIDFDNHTVKKGTTSLYSAVTFAGSTWWTLAPGENEVEAIATGAGATTKVTMSYRDTFL